jgi:hypothetical protein
VTMLAVIAFIAFVWWFYRQRVLLPRRSAQLHAVAPIFHDFRAIPGTNLEECRTPGCHARQWRQP